MIIFPALDAAARPTRITLGATERGDLHSYGFTGGPFRWGKLYIESFEESVDFLNIIAFDCYIKKGVASYARNY